MLNPIQDVEERWIEIYVSVVDIRAQEVHSTRTRFYLSSENRDTNDDKSEELGPILPPITSDSNVIKLVGAIQVGWYHEI